MHGLGRYCCDAERMKALAVLEFFRRSGLECLGPLTFTFVVNCAFSIISFQLMMCGCVQHRSTRKRRIGEYIGIFAFAFMSGLLLLMAKDKLVEIWRHGKILQVFADVVVAKLMCWCGASLFNFVVFCALFRLQRPKQLGDCLKWTD